ncbi:MAG: hypothetical protein AAFX80_18640 [Cyanobacteria bacterium J06639_18]
MFVVVLCPDGHANANSAIVEILVLKRYYDEPYRKCFTGHEIMIGISTEFLYLKNMVAI